MAASRLYEMLIDNPTKNMKRIQAKGIEALMREPVERRTQGLLPEARFMHDVSQRQYHQQFELDAALWYGAILTGPYGMLLRKIFHMFYYAGIIYDDGAGWKDWADNGLVNVASLLSHGQRVLVQIPPISKGGDALWRWLNHEQKIPWRTVATHGITTEPNPGLLMRGHWQYVRELKGKGVAVMGIGSHYGFNPALGGLGNRNPFSAKNEDTKAVFTPIKADGSNGHVYVFYLAPGKGWAGGLLVGCENAASGKKNKHTGASHSVTGAAQKVSACGGKKWSDLNVGPREEYSGMICDLTGRGDNLNWLFGLSLFNPDWLDRRPYPVYDLLAYVPNVVDAPSRGRAVAIGGAPHAANVAPARAIPK